MSSTEKPVILMDMDGPLADFDRKFFEACELNGWHIDCTLEEQRHRFATDHIPDEEHRRLARNHVDTTRWFLDLPVVPGAIEGMAYLEEHADVWIVTKPLEVNATCRDDKATWLAGNFGEQWVRKLIITPDKSMVRGHILVDDAPNPDWYPRAEWEPVIYSTSWNGDGSKWANTEDYLYFRFTWDLGAERLIETAEVMQALGFSSFNREAFR